MFLSDFVSKVINLKSKNANSNFCFKEGDGL